MCLNSSLSKLVLSNYFERKCEISLFYIMIFKVKKLQLIRNIHLFLNFHMNQNNISFIYLNLNFTGFIIYCTQFNYIILGRRIFVQIFNIEASRQSAITVDFVFLFQEINSVLSIMSLEQACLFDMYYLKFCWCKQEKENFPLVIGTCLFHFKCTILLSVMISYPLMSSNIFTDQ